MRLFEMVGRRFIDVFLHDFRELDLAVGAHDGASQRSISLDGKFTAAQQVKSTRLV